ncbi:MAG TPA: metal-dependent hydrolase [Caldilineaceae bacterium]|nr:metal-dependent hydrolase [Caldilineaceae bacterium]
MLLIILLVVAVMAIGDAVVYAWPAWAPRPLWALLDPVVHVLLSVAVISPLLAHTALAGRAWLWVLAAAAATVLIDLDHFVAARTLSLAEALALPSRPPTHSLLFALGCAVITAALTRNLLGGGVVFGSLASHVLRDASHYGAPLLWPLVKQTTLSLPAYYAAHVGLCLLAGIVAGWPFRTLWSHRLSQQAAQLWQMLQS